jgi:hypothetical protein
LYPRNIVGAAGPAMPNVVNWDLHSGVFGLDPNLRRL